MVFRFCPKQMQLGADPSLRVLYGDLRLGDEVTSGIGFLIQNPNLLIGVSEAEISEFVNNNPHEFKIAYPIVIPGGKWTVQEVVLSRLYDEGLDNLVVGVVHYTPDMTDLSGYYLVARREGNQGISQRAHLQ